MPIAPIAAAFLVLCVGLFVLGRKAQAPASGRGRVGMQDIEEEKTRRIQAVYARARLKLDLLRRERRFVMARLAKKVDDHRIGEAKKRISEL